MLRIASEILTKFITTLGAATVLAIAAVSFVQAQEGQTAISVQAVPAARRPVVETIPVTGTLTPPRQAMLSVEVAGLVNKMHVDVGDRVEAGAPLLELDRELNGIARDAALAEVEQAREALAESRRRLGEAQALVGDNYISETEVLALTSEVRIREAEFRAAQIEAERQSALLRRHQVKAPFTGAIAQRMAELGEWVEPGVALFELVDARRLRADFEVPQRVYGRISEETPLEVQFDASGARRFPARVLHKVPLSRSGARTFLLRTEITGERTPELIAGMSVSATLRLGTERTAVAVPRDAVIRYPDGRVTVWVAAQADWGAKTTVREQPVQTGLGFDGWIEIREGLSPNATVITRGNESLRDGQQVILQRAPQESRAPAPG
ncbi:Multidrug efflux pump subunit AcrA precursor [Microbulbifer aggregans]|uniref:Multidrug efflux pump subunit AcrA n=1 Tax=Microbulbifer aggregans TaxID=1769779 RepID=A0A1C9W974_9GAMM|nr:efflux RND transporter periplasmic adaptor subunit [Microbulbifer aggregans]AOS97708.1 Multidrug efflux pump subunit AcrA precursor [Microbulbifer aggregans]